jgi:large subunit ribosomal protein L6
MKIFTKIIILEGTAARAKIEFRNNKKYLILNVGKSHEDLIIIPDELNIEIFFDTRIKVSGIDPTLVGTFLDKIRFKRKPNPYSGSGIYYFNETIKRKKGKKK